MFEAELLDISDAEFIDHFRDIGEVTIENILEAYGHLAANYLDRVIDRFKYEILTSWRIVVIADVSTLRQLFPNGKSTLAKELPEASNCKESPGVPENESSHSGTNEKATEASESEEDDDDGGNCPSGITRNEYRSWRRATGAGARCVPTRAQLDDLVEEEAEYCLDMWPYSQSPDLSVNPQWRRVFKIQASRMSDFQAWRAACRDRRAIEFDVIYWKWSTRLRTHFDDIGEMAPETEKIAQFWSELPMIAEHEKEARLVEHVDDLNEGLARHSCPVTIDLEAIHYNMARQDDRTEWLEYIAYELLWLDLYERYEKTYGDGLRNLGLWPLDRHPTNQELMKIGPIGLTVLCMKEKEAKECLDKAKEVALELMTVEPDDVPDWDRHSEQSVKATDEFKKLQKKYSRISERRELVEDYLPVGQIHQYCYNWIRGLKGRITWAIANTPAIPIEDDDSDSNDSYNCSDIDMAELQVGSTEIVLWRPNSPSTSSETSSSSSPEESPEPERIYEPKHRTLTATRSLLKPPWKLVKDLRIAPVKNVSWREGVRFELKRSRSEWEEACVWKRLRGEMWRPVDY